MTITKDIRVGGHVSAAGGVYRCFVNAEVIGANCIQIFGASPRQWAVRSIKKQDIDAFKKEQARTKINPVFLHAAYLPNLASPDKETQKKSIENLSAHLAIAESLGANGLIFHIGSHRGVTRDEGIALVVKGMKEVLRRVPGKSLLIIENSAGGGNKLGSTVADLADLIHGAKQERVKLCIDTQHAFAAGVFSTYSQKEVDTFVTNIEKQIGWKHIVALHINDSKSQSGSHYDRHENIGEGHIGRAGFVHLSENPRFRGLPWILEVPGFDNTGPDKRNIDILKSILRYPQ